MRLAHAKLAVPALLLLAASGCKRSLDLTLKVQLSRDGKPLPHESFHLEGEALWYDAPHLSVTAHQPPVSYSASFPPKRGILSRQTFRGSIQARTDAQGWFVLERKEWNPPSYRPDPVTARLTATVGKETTTCKLLVIPTTIEMSNPISQITSRIFGDNGKPGPIRAEADCDLSKPAQDPLYYVPDSVIEGYLKLDKTDYTEDGSANKGASVRAYKPDFFFSPESPEQLKITPSNATGAR